MLCCTAATGGMPAVRLEVASAPASGTEVDCTAQPAALYCSVPFMQRMHAVLCPEAPRCRSSPPPVPSCKIHASIWLMTGQMPAPLPVGKGAGLAWQEHSAKRRFVHQLVSSGALLAVPVPQPLPPDCTGSRLICIWDRSCTWHAGKLLRSLQHTPRPRPPAESRSGVQFPTSSPTLARREGKGIPPGVPLPPCREVPHGTPTVPTHQTCTEGAPRVPPGTGLPDA